MLLSITCSYHLSAKTLPFFFSSDIRSTFEIEREIESKEPCIEQTKMAASGSVL